MLQADTFRIMFSEGRTVVQIGNALGITPWKAYSLKKQLGLKRARWELAGLPARFSTESVALVHGTLLGDASLVAPVSSKFATLSVSHADKSRQYLEWKREQLRELKPHAIRPGSDGWGTLRFTTPPHPQLQKLREALYPDGRKTIFPEFLEILTPAALALWFMDDGSATTNGFSIATCAFSPEENAMLVAYLERRWGVLSLVGLSDYPRLRLNKDGARRFEELISPFVVPSMQYKLQRRAQ
jgi:recombination protein RecA